MQPVEEGVQVNCQPVPSLEAPRVAQRPQQFGLIIFPLHSHKLPHLPPTPHSRNQQQNDLSVEVSNDYPLNDYDSPASQKIYDDFNKQSL